MPLPRPADPLRLPLDDINEVGGSPRDQGARRVIAQIAAILHAHGLTTKPAEPHEEEQ